MDPETAALLEQLRQAGISTPGALPPTAFGMPDLGVLRGQGALFGVPLGATYTPPERAPQIPQALLEQAETRTATQRYAPDLRRFLPPMAADYLQELARYPVMPGIRLPMGGPGIAPQAPAPQPQAPPPASPQGPPAPTYRATDHLPDTPFGWNPPRYEPMSRYPRFMDDLRLGRVPPPDKEPPVKAPEQAYNQALDYGMPKPEGYQKPKGKAWKPSDPVEALPRELTTQELQALIEALRK